MFPTNVCFGKYNLKLMIGHRAYLKDMAKLTSFKPVLALITRVISSVHGTI